MMLRKTEILNSKKIKQILKIMKDQWSFTEKLDYGFLQKENDIFLVTRDIDKINLQ